MMTEVIVIAIRITDAVVTKYSTIEWLLKEDWTCKNNQIIPDLGLLNRKAFLKKLTI